MTELQDAWATLGNADENPLYAFDWYASCYDTLHGDDDLRLVVSRSHDGVVDGIAPLVRTRRGRTEWLEFIGASYLYEPCSVLATSSASRRDIYEALAHTSDPVMLSRVEHTPDPLPKSLRTGFWLRKDASGAPTLDLESGREAFLQTLSKSRRSDLRRAERRAAAYGDLNFVVDRPGENAVQQSLGLAMAIEDKSWKARRGSSLAMNPRLASFFADYCTRSATSQRLRIFFLKAGNTPVATAICLETSSAIWFLKIGYDEEYADCSPGILLLTKIVEYCCDNRIGKIEHLGAPANWLSPWTSYIRRHSTYIHYPLNMKGAGLMTRDIARSVGARVLRRSNTNGRQ